MLKAFPWKQLLGASLIAVLGCSNETVTDTGEVAQSVGDAVASIDEATSGGGFAELLPMYRAPDYLRPGFIERTVDALLPKAYGATCSSVTFDACAGGERVKTWNNCTIGSATLSGTVRLAFSRAGCQLTTLGDTISRVPDFTLTGTRGATLTVSASGQGSGSGQTLTKTAGGFTFSVGGVNRTATRTDGGVLFNITTQTSSPITVTGANRANRVINGGAFVITHNVAGFTTELTPTNVTWAAGCNCPTSGSFAGTLSGSRTGSFTIDITGCGSANVTVNGQTESVTFDRCYGI